MSERIAYDEFGLFHENAAEYDLPFDEPPLVRRETVEIEPGRHLSALMWGTRPAELVFVHGGAQNAHTWDTVALALGRPLVAIDLPGHGHSDGPRAGSGGQLSPDANALDLAAAVEALAPDALAVVGMSLGGLSAIALAGHAPHLVRSLVLVDVTPGVTGEKSRSITEFVNGPETFASFDEILARTIAFNPTRSVSSLRRGILHNAVQRGDGTWVWRYRRFPVPGGPAEGASRPDFAALWDVLERIAVPVMLVRGMRTQSVVDDADETELLRRVPRARVERVAEAGHSVQGDAPLEVAALVDDFVRRTGPGSA